MVKIENWNIFPESVDVPIRTCNLYEHFGLQPPDLSLADEKIRKKLEPYLLEDVDSFDYAKFRKDFIVIFVSINPKLKEGWSLEYGLLKAALEIAAEESTGTWDPDLKTILPEEMDENSKKNMEILRGKVIGLNVKNGMAAIAYPKQGFEYGNLPQLLSIIIGNYTGMTSVAWGVRLEDVDFPDDYVNSFDGPSLGNEGIKKIVGDQITVGTIVKPKTGLSEADWAKTAERSYMGGLDVVKDDENLTSQDYCDFYKRAELVLEAIKRVKEQTGREVIYVANITHGSIDEMMKRAEFIRDHGGNCLMIDILAAGMTAVQTIRKKFPNMILHGHRAGHGAQTLFPEIVVDGKKIELRHGISMKVWALIARLAGIDQLHIGAPKGKMEKDAKTVLENLEACMRPLGNIKTVRPIASGGLKATVLWDVANIMNPEGDGPTKDLVFQAGGGTHAHPFGTFAGAKSMVQARDAVNNGIDKFTAISNNFELMLAFRRWDHDIYVEWLKQLKPESKIVVDLDKRPYPKDGKYSEPGPQPVSLKDAIEKYPPLKDDLEKFNPDILLSI